MAPQPTHFYFLAKTYAVLDRTLTPFKQKLLTTSYYGAIAFTLYIASSTAQLRELYLSKRNL
ncbi:hypothetical protein [Nostoc sphaeroides]|uniref:Uncharacterized protein n=1 Tax=Nostoc sphaeroides CCNUC1 TaxID=2653204 RepID=A0A5P8W9L8_9NOSO|nr:hypothetical protein [Nostoc sphaeroides]QFS49455.1 hypothetical protein GXM_06949 [Nostoc sphaeroides CCNUC1]